MIPQRIEPLAEPLGEPALRIDALTIEATASKVPIVSDISLQVTRGRLLGLVGESGSGKSSIGLAALGHVRPGARVVHGRAVVDGVDLLALRGTALQRRRGRLVAYVPQDPASALNPALRIERQLAEVLAVHEAGLSGAARSTRVREALAEVRLPPGREFLRRFPHQLSGGQQQRVVLAMAFLANPQVIVFDEPTTGLDVSTQAHLLDTIGGLCGAHGTAGIYISHDLAVVAEIVDHVAILYAGRVVESGPAGLLAGAARHPYTVGLVDAVPRPTRALAGIPGHPPTPTERAVVGCAFARRCAHVDVSCRLTTPDQVTVAVGHIVRCSRLEVIAARAGPAPQAVVLAAPPRDDVVISTTHLSARHGGTEVVHDVSFDLVRGETLALVGSSASGKTTIARALVGLHPRSSGQLLLDGVDLAPRVEDRPAAARRAIQLVFQNPHGALNPRRSVEAILRRPLEVFDGKAAARGATDRIVGALAHVALDRSVLRRYPRELSGGERQRVAIARALVVNPSVLICDEVTSALDVSVQATIVSLLRDLQRDPELALCVLFVTHNLPLVRHLAHRVVVLHDGGVVEAGSVADIFDAPQTAYTAQLLADTPHLIDPDEVRTTL